MGQLLLGLFAVVSGGAAFWAAGQMAPRTAISPEEALRAELALFAGARRLACLPASGHRTSFP